MVPLFRAGVVVTLPTAWNRTYLNRPGFGPVCLTTSRVSGQLAGPPQVIRKTSTGSPAAILLTVAARKIWVPAEFRTYTSISFAVRSR